ncbi:MAG: mandelate racemase/muconate lactonizing enzyme family protein [candidate division KSB1 bacterium]|nr:mandelate racemase/muconate lactonizing enzyme family protein [candidate division KSB1 bacterium]MDZ7273547.1 mandelate racemase/muconate lactonizing enzyme family protein [candidate division KSB1 bacterium]MDZ7286862.1 mandelate racemase/muconate lactonizing enzyme family protein [candidate division KSB1 bacterium]MDZ7299785.1 mandelate racemase/muconate lactonizing enzyme family protein [candidate division KSB1 bacterium]MDZ7307668.1 mandelate racemase/muconate lactonizing enzyme family pr
MKTKLQKLDRRNFIRTLAGGLGGFAATSWLAPSPSPALARPMENARAAFNNLKITELKFLKLQFPGKTPVKRNAIITSGGEAPSLKMLELYTNQGLIGRSLPKGPDSLIKSAFSKIRGENPFDVERLWDHMYRDNRKSVAKGEYIEAIGSLDMAIWDLIGKALELPVYRVLGAYQTRLRVYAAGGYYEEGKTVADLVKEMEGYVSEGFRAVKMKVGGESFSVDVERVRAVREALGPDIDLMIDANNKWLAYDAIRFGRAVEKYNLFWFEEPVVADDFAGCAEVRQALDIPIVAGENEYTRWGCRDLITAGSADILNLDTVKAGGITEYRKIAALASAFHIPVAPHGSPHMAVHLLAATPNALIMETYPGVESQYNPALPLFPVKDGFITVPDKPGLGIDPDPALVQKYMVSLQ